MATRDSLLVRTAHGPVLGYADTCKLAARSTAARDDRRRPPVSKWLVSPPAPSPPPLFAPAGTEEPPHARR